METHLKADGDAPRVKPHHKKSRHEVRIASLRYPHTWDSTTKSTLASALNLGDVGGVDRDEDLIHFTEGTRQVP